MQNIEQISPLAEEQTAYPQTKTVVQLDWDGYFIGLTQADLSPLEAKQGVYLFPSGAIDIEPPEEKAGHVAKWQNNEWHYLPDYRGTTVYSTTDKSTIVIDTVGDVPVGYTLIKPDSPLASWDGEKWAVSAQKAAEQAEKARNELINHIDDTAAQIAAHWTRFSDEYKERESAALAYQQANFTNEPSIYITSFSSVAGLDDKSATLLILQQAAGLRHLQEQLAVQRMRKYELKKPDLTIEQMQELHDDIINQMHQLAGAAQ